MWGYLFECKFFYSPWHWPVGHSGVIPDLELPDPGEEEPEEPELVLLEWTPVIGSRPYDMLAGARKADSLIGTVRPRRLSSGGRLNSY